MSSKIGNRITLQQARTLGAVQSFEPLGSDKGAGARSITNGNGTVTSTARADRLSMTASPAAAWSNLVTMPQWMAGGQIVLFTAWKTNQPIANLDNLYQIGVLWRGSMDLTPEEEAIFAPGAGNSTNGNIRVRKSGTITNGSITYPTLDGNEIFANILIDYDRDQTEFYINKNPITATPDATIAAVPNYVPSVGILIQDNGSGTDTSEILDAVLLGYIYIP